MNIELEEIINMELRLAEVNDLDIINSIYRNAIDRMIRNKIFQLDEIYPNFGGKK